MTSHRQSWFEGWRLFATLSLTARPALRLDRLDAAVRGRRRAHGDPLTARTSLLFFCLAFSAAALARLWPNAWTRWQRRNRRYLGVTFRPRTACTPSRSVCFAVMDPVCLYGRDLGGLLHFRRLGYAFIIAMAATSFDGQPGDRPARLARAASHWRLLSAVSVHGVVRQADSDMPLYALFLIPLIAVFAMRMISMRQGRAADGAGWIARSVFADPMNWRPSLRCTVMTARSTSLIRLSPRTTLGISQLRPPPGFESAEDRWTRAVSQPGSLRSASLQAPSARPVFPIVMPRGAHADGISRDAWR